MSEEMSGGTRILLVEDNAFMRGTIKTLLRVLGHLLVDEASDGRAALAAIAKHKPDLVLCDLEMKPMSGTQLIEQLRNHADEGLRSLPVIVITGHADEASVRGAVSLAISGYLLKPVALRDLRARLQAVLGRAPEAPVAAAQ
jgi:two-component system chemotaxis response regulator CheY